MKSRPNFLTVFPQLAFPDSRLLGFRGISPRNEIDNVYDGASNWIFHTGIRPLKFGIGVRSLSHWLADEAGVTHVTTTPAYRQMHYGVYIVTINLFQRLYLELRVRYDVFSPVEPAQAGGAVVIRSVLQYGDIPPCERGGYVPRAPMSAT
jgi:hypothetical protein